MKTTDFVTDRFPTAAAAAAAKEPFNSKRVRVNIRMSTFFFFVVKFVSNKLVELDFEF